LTILCPVCDSRTVVLIRENHRKDVTSYHPSVGELGAFAWILRLEARLSDVLDAEVVPLPMPSPLYFDGFSSAAGQLSPISYISKRAAVPSAGRSTTQARIGAGHELGGG